MHGDEAETEGGGDEGAGDYDVEGAEEVGEDVGNDTYCNASAYTTTVEMQEGVGMGKVG